MKIRYVKKVNDLPDDGLTIGNVYDVTADNSDDKHHPSINVLDDLGEYNTVYEGEYEVVEE